MKVFSLVLFGATVASVLPLVADAAGTYYNGNLYQNPNAGGFYNTYGAGRGYGQNTQNLGVKKTTVQTVKKTTKKANNAQKQGFQIGINFAHEFADWSFDMKTAGSKLHYDNLRWNVLDGEAAYYFDGSFPLQIKVGGRYGMQFGDSSMVDDDISSGKMWVVYSEGEFEGLPAASIGTSKDGSQYGFNAAIGFTDLFDAGALKFTPSVGYRYLKYKLETKNNYGMMIQVYNNSPSVVNCVSVDNGEIQCIPVVGFSNGGEWLAIGGLAQNTDGSFVVAQDGSYLVTNGGGSYLDLGQTYYYEQSGTSHKYETEWAGPYIALDMEYAINDDNVVNAGIEFGLPLYESTGDQPYRFDWGHPTSVKDKADFGDAYHLGLNAEWSTAVSDSVMLSLGMTYDYYHVSDATATTYLNRTYYTQLYESGIMTEADYSYYESIGWAQESKDEIESVYKSMGIRLGFSAKF